MSVIESPRNEIELEVGSRKAEEDSALSRCPRTTENELYRFLREPIKQRH